jgi:hypothetical protein
MLGEEIQSNSKARVNASKMTVFQAGLTKLWKFLLIRTKLRCKRENHGGVRVHCRGNCDRDPPLQRRIVGPTRLMAPRVMADGGRIIRRRSGD